MKINIYTADSALYPGGHLTQATTSLTPSETNTLLLTLAVAVLYVITAKLGFLLAVPPGNITAIWPPSGIALAATLLYGWRATIGIWIGSCLVNFWTLEHNLIAQIATTIALGSSLQAALGGYLLRRYVFTSGTLSPEGSRKILGFFLICGGCCTIAASFGIASLYLGDVPGTRQWTVLWWTWWIGDYAGMLLITPLLLKLQQWLKGQHRKQSWLLCICSALLSLSLINFIFVLQNHVKQFQQELDNKALIFQLQLQREIDVGTERLENLATYLSLETRVDRHKFSLLAKQLLKHSPAISALTWAPAINKTQLTEHLADARNAGFADYQLHEKNQNNQRIPVSTQRDMYYPIYFIEPEIKNSALRGFDNGSEGKRRAALELARDSHSITSTGLIQPLQGGNENNFVLLYQPVFAADEQKKTLHGFVVSLIRLDELIARSMKISEFESINTSLWDISIKDKPTLLSSTLSQDAPASQRLSSNTTINAANRLWRIDIYPAATALKKLYPLSIWMALVIGICIPLIILGYAHNRRKRIEVIETLNQSLEQRIEERTILLKTNEESLRLAVDRLNQRHDNDRRLAKLLHDLYASENLAKSAALIEEHLPFLMPNTLGNILLETNPGQWTNLLHWSCDTQFIPPKKLTFDNCDCLASGTHCLKQCTDKLCLASEHINPQTGGKNYYFYCDPRTTAGNDRAIVHITGIAPVSEQDMNSRLERANDIINQIWLVLANAQLREILKSQALRDGLTDLYNRRFLDDILEKEISRSIRNAIPLAIAIIDIDFFKKINDQHGHRVGDLALKKLAKDLQQHIRSSDYACRFGGEEFVLIMPDCLPEQASSRMEALRQKVTTTPIDNHDQPLAITISIGIAHCPQHADSASSLLEAADHALYEAKASGRNRIVVA